MALRVDWRSIRFRLEYAVFRLHARVFRALGLERASTLSGKIWRWCAPLLSRHERALGHLARAFPEKTRAELQAICRDMWENLGRTFAESFFLKEIYDSDRIAIEGYDVFERWAAEPGGKVACAGHLANWELSIMGLTRSGLRPWSIYRPIKNPLVDRDALEMRGFLYPGGLMAKHNPTVPRLFLRIVRDGGTIGFLTDLRDNAGIDVPFFGRPAPTTSFPALLAQSSGNPILVSSLRRLPGVRFVQTCELVHVPNTGDRRADVATATADLQATFERFIRRAPEQWLWAHRRWR